MVESVFYEMEFSLLVVFSIFVPTAIYVFLYKKIAISRWTIIGFAFLLLLISGIDVYLLQSLSEKAKTSRSLIDHKLFMGQLSLALYLFPALFATVGMNLISHVLINHLNEAEARYDNAREQDRQKRTSLVSHQLVVWKQFSERSILILSSLGIGLLFILDLLTGAEIRLHVLYNFPLAI